MKSRSNASPINKSEKQPLPKIHFYTENHIQSEILTYLLLAKKIMKDHTKGKS